MSAASSLIVAINSPAEFSPDTFHDLGIGVEIQGLHTEGISEDELAQRLADYQALLAGFKGAISVHGIVLPALTSPLPANQAANLEAHYRKSIEIARSLGATTLILHSLLPPETNPQTDAIIDQLAALWQVLVAELSGSTLTLALENVVEKTPDNLLKLVKAINSPRVGICLDIGHIALFSRQQIEEWVSHCSYYVNYIHVHDNSGEADDHKPAPPETWHTLLSILASYELKPPLSLEYHNLNANAQRYEIRNAKRLLRNFQKTRSTPRDPQFFTRIVLPSLIAVGLFVLALFLVVIPIVENAMLDRKKEMIRELTVSALSILTSFHNDELAGRLTRAQAQARASQLIRNIRYGLANKDYFWITTTEPRMVMHPYRPDLNTRSLTDFSDREGKKLFVAFVRIVNQSPQHEGYDTYQWQWMDNPDKVVPKLSFVKRFEPWSWIIGTGIYIEDIKEEMATFKRLLLYILSGITFILAVLITYVIHQSLKIEQRRQNADKGLAESREKYRALVAASTEAIMMALDHRIIYANRVAADILGYSESELLKLDLSEIFLPPPPHKRTRRIDTVLDQLKRGEIVHDQVELTLKKQNGAAIAAFLTLSPINLNAQTGQIVIIRDIDPAAGYGTYFEKASTRSRRIESHDAALQDMEILIHTMHQPVMNHVVPIPVCIAAMSIGEALSLMRHHKADAVIVHSNESLPIGIVTATDIQNRVIAEGLDTQRPVAQVMSAPLITVPGSAMVYEAQLTMRQHDLSHLIVTGASGQILGMLTLRLIARLSEFLPLTLCHEIRSARCMDDLAAAQKKITELVALLIESELNAQRINHLITFMADLIIERTIQFALAELGPAPCSFAFMVMGSEGREEQTLSTDQDNAIVFEDCAPDQLPGRLQYFQALGESVCSRLDLLGYFYCKGDFMAGNSRWCQPVSVWKKAFQEWIVRAESDDLLKLNTFMDMRCLYGEKSLETDLFQTVRSYFAKRENLVTLLEFDALKAHLPLTLLGTLAVASDGEHRDTFDVKDVLAVVANLARVFALKCTPYVRNTEERLQVAMDNGLLSQSHFHDLINAYRYLMRLRLAHQVAQIRMQQEPDNHLNPKALPALDLVLAKESVQIIQLFQKRLDTRFNH